MVTQRLNPRTSAVDYAAGFWLVCAIVGQLAFFAYIFLVYIVPATSGSFEKWNSNPLLAEPPVAPGATLSTAMFGTHAIGAAWIALFGALQFIPYLRRKAPALHRWSGRIFLITVVALSISGYYIVWIRGPQPSEFADLATSVNGVLILSFAYFAIRSALDKRFAEHEKWTVRLYLVSSAQWFLRIGGFTYFAIMQSLGHEISIEDWFFEVWMWGSFIVPVALAELYFRTRRATKAIVKVSASGTLVLASLLTLGGSFVFSMLVLQLLSST